MGIEPTQQLFTATLVLKTRRPTRRLGTSNWTLILTYNASSLQQSKIGLCKGQETRTGFAKIRGLVYNA
jgi:hypothetical protein